MAALDRSSHDTAPLLALALELAERAGDLLLAGRVGRLADVATKSSATDMVGAMDRASERLIVEGLRVARPGDAVVAEEGTADTGSSGVTWVVDPLDGTTNYLYGLAGFGVSIAAEVGGQTVVGVVVDPTAGETFAATIGGGATCNDLPVVCSTASDPALALVGTGFSYEAERRAGQAAVLATVLPAVRDIRRAGAAAVDLCSVACGRLDAFFERGLRPWDLAAGALIATEAGALTGDLAGGPASGGYALAAPPLLFEPMRSLLVAGGAGGDD